MILSFGNMNLEFNIFYLHRRVSRFDNIETSTLNSVEDFIFDDKFAPTYKSFSNCLWAWIW